jgi:hypothetical protein
MHLKAHEIEFLVNRHYVMDKKSNTKSIEGCGGGAWAQKWAEAMDRQSAFNFWRQQELPEDPNSTLSMDQSLTQLWCPIIPIIL